MPRPREQVALVVVAPPVGQDEVFNGVDAAADPRYEVISIGGDAEVPAAVTALAALQDGDAVSQRFGRNDPVRSEQVTMQVPLGGGHIVDLRDHPGPVQLDQGTYQRHVIAMENMRGCFNLALGIPPLALPAGACERAGWMVTRCV